MYLDEPDENEVVETVVETGLCGKYFVQTEDALLAVVFGEGRVEIWLHDDIEPLRILPRHDEGCVQPLLPFGHIARCEKLTEKYQSFFASALRLIESFHDGKHCLLHFFLQYGAPAVELAESCCALAYMCATECFTLPFSPAEKAGVRWPLKKRSEILEAFDFPAQKWVVKLFDKVPVSECRSELFEDLRLLLRSDDAKVLKVLKHLKAINRFVLNLLLEGRLYHYFHKNFLDQLSVSVSPSAERRVKDLLSFVEELDVAVQRGFKAKLVWNDVDALVLHDELVAWRYQRNPPMSFGEEDLDFCDPPLPELLISEEKDRKLGIFPLKNSEELREEGRKQKHCISFFARLIFNSKGKFYAYHIELTNETATMLLEKKHGSWSIVEIRGPGNSKVTANLLKIVNRWLLGQVNL